MALSIEYAPVYYDSNAAGELSYNDYMQKIAMTHDITDSIARGAESINSRIVNAQIATANAIYNNTRDVIGAFNSGFSGVSRQIGAMGAQMSIGFAALNTAVQESSQAICDRLDAMNDILNNPSLTKTRELFRRASVNYNKGFYEEAKNDLLEALASNKTDYISWFLLGKTYLFGAGEFSNVIDLVAAVDALKNAVKYITPDARKQEDVRVMASEMCFYLGLAQQTKALDSLHAKNEADCRSFLEQAGGSYGQSYDYSPQMLEARYNRARCKVLLGDVSGALADLETVVPQDRNYCVKVCADNDFSGITEQFAALIKKLKNEAFISAKKDYDRIKPLMSELASIGGTVKVTEPAACNEDASYFDVLDYAKNIKQIISVVEKAITGGKRAKHLTCIVAGVSHTVGLKTDGTVVAVGNNSSGRCNVSVWRDIVAVATYGTHTVGLKADGTVVAVGWNGKSDAKLGEVHCGQCDVSNWRDVVAVSVAGLKTVGLRAYGTVVAVGDNEKGQCNVSAWRDIKAIAVGNGHTVGLKADGTVVAVGENSSGQCNVGAWRDVIAVSAFGQNTVGLKADGTVVAVGWNKDGQCNVGAWSDIIAVSVAGHTVGLKADGTVVAVGSNEKGQCDVSAWRNIGPVSEEQVLKWKQAKAEQDARKAEEKRQAAKAKAEQEAREAEEAKEKQRIAEQQQQWQAQGLCKYCGGKLGGLFAKKCKDCGKEN